MKPILKALITLKALLLLLVCSSPVFAGQTYPFLNCFEIASRQFQVSLTLLLAVAKTESNWDPDARSHANAHGIMQIRWPQTARHLGAGRVSELYNPCLNINLGARYLKELLDRYRGNQLLALAAYNYGPSRIVSSSDVPEVVMVYVHRVEVAQQRISSSMESQMPRLMKTTTTIEINRFSNRQRAVGYVTVLKKVVPDASFSLSRSGDGLHVVTVDTRELSTRSKFQLMSIIPDSWQEADK